MRKTVIAAALAAVFILAPASGSIRAAEAKKTPAAATTKNKQGGFFDIFKKNPFSGISFHKREEPKDMDAIADYLSSRGIKGTPVASGIIERGLLQFCFGLRGVAADKFIFVNSGGEVLYFIFEFPTRVEAQAAVPVIVTCVSALAELEEGELYAAAKYRFVVGAKRSSKKAVNAIEQY